MGYSGYQFIKLPTFGWYAYNENKSFIGNIFNLVKAEEHSNLYDFVVKNKPGYLDFKIAYSEVSAQRLRNNLTQIQIWTACYVASKLEVDKHLVRYNGRRVLLKDVLNEHGMSNLLQNNVGLISSHICNTFSMLPWPKDCVGKLLIPSFCTPQHICSLDLVHWTQLDKIQNIFTNDEKGWYGQVNHRIVKDLKELSTTPGNTWDYKCDYWTDKVVPISEHLETSEYIKIWTEAKNTHFSNSPLEYIVKARRTDELKNHVSSLSYQQIAEMEKITGESLKECWKKSRENEILLGTQTFIKRDNCYYIRNKRGVYIQVSNFTIDIEAIYKRGNKFFRKGHIYYRDAIMPFEMEQKFFNSHHMFKKGINHKFLETGLGVPIISPQFENTILQIVDSFNENIKISSEEP